MTVYSNSFTITETTAPSWFTAMADKEWIKLASQADFQAVIQTPQPAVGNSTGAHSAIGTWVGGCVDQVRGDILFLANGGHNDYSGNEGYLFRLLTDSPQWYRLYDRTPDGSIVLTTTPNVARVDYADGLPRAQHTWNVPVFAEGFGKMVLAYTGDYSADPGSQNPGVWTFDRDLCGEDYSAFPIAYATIAANGGNGPTGYWQFGGTAWSVQPTNPIVEASMAYWDPQNNEVMGLGKTPAEWPTQPNWAIDPETGAINAKYSAVPSGSDPVGIWAAAARTSPAVAVFARYATTQIYTWDLSNRSTASWVQVQPSGNPGPYAGEVGWYGVWHDASNAFLMYNQARQGGSKTIVKLTMDNPSDPVNSTWTWGTVAGAAGGATPEASTVTMYSKFNIVRNMGNGQSCLVSVAYNSGVYAYKVPLGGV